MTYFTMNLYCANCGHINDERWIDYSNMKSWDGFCHSCNYKFRCYYCGTLQEGLLKSKQYQDKEIEEVEHYHDT